MVALDDGDRPPGPEQLPERGQGLDRPQEVLQDEADEDVVEGLGAKGQGEDVRLLELHVGGPAASAPALACARDSAEMSTETMRAPGLLRARGMVWAPMPHPASSTELPLGYDVSEWSSSSNVCAWSCKRTLSRRS